MTMPQPELIYYVGLAIYTFEDLLLKGQAVTSLISRLQHSFSAFPLSVFKAVTVLQQKQETVVKTQPWIWTGLESEIRGGRISRFQAQDTDDSLAAKIVLRIRLDLTHRYSKRPNHLLLRLPVEYFTTHREEATRALLYFGKEAFKQLQAAYGYGGIRITGRSSDIVNQAINENIGSIPVGDLLDVNIEADFHDHVKGAFWANFLNKRHVDALGGWEIMEQSGQTVPCHKVERLDNGGSLLVLTPGPVPVNEDEEKLLYAKLRRFLGPITASKRPTIPAGLEKSGKVFRRSYNT
jgi:hypothetical protein